MATRDTAGMLEMTTAAAAAGHTDPDPQEESDDEIKVSLSWALGWARARRARGYTYVISSTWSRRMFQETKCTMLGDATHAMPAVVLARAHRREVERMRACLAGACMLIVCVVSSISSLV